MFRMFLCACCAVILFTSSLPAADDAPRERARRGNRDQARERGPQSPVEGFVLKTDVEYGKAGERSLTLDILHPDMPKGASLPAIVWIHGGGWRGGSKNGGIQRVLQAVGRDGEFVIASVGYRLSGEAKWPAQIHDCKAAIRYLRANAAQYGIDGTQIGVWGSSAGGHLVSLLGTSGGVEELEGENGTPGVKSNVQCVVDYCGPSDFLAFAAGASENAGSALQQLFGGPVADNKEAARLASPVTHVTKDDPPFLVVHGTKDGTVPLAQAELFYDALQGAGVDVLFVRMQGGGHGIGGEEINQRVRAFFERHLLGHEAPVSEEPIEVAQQPQRSRAQGAQPRPQPRQRDGQQRDGNK